MKLYNEDCMKQMQEMIDDGIQVDSVVTDPPYGIHFMGKDWDKFKGTKVTKSQVVTNLGAGMRMTTYEENMDFQKWCNEWATLCLKLLKPGGYILAFSSARTYHHLACGIESAGFEVRDQLMWLYGSGFPKSMNIGMQIDKKLGNKRKVIGKKMGKGGENLNKLSREGKGDSEEAKGLGAYGLGAKQTNIEIDITEPASPEAKQWEGWGTALKPAHEPIVMARKPLEGTVADNVLKHGTGGINIDDCRIDLSEGDDPRLGGKGTWKTDKMAKDVYVGGYAGEDQGSSELGRFPANVMHDGLEQEWARFFYCPKVSKSERNRGLDKNNHPTVKPIELMKYLCRLVTPKGGIVLDPFMGSGSTGLAAKDEGFDFVGIEREKEYFEIAEARINASSPLLDFFE